MNVRELREALANHPDDMQVFVIEPDDRSHRELDPDVDLDRGFQFPEGRYDEYGQSWRWKVSSSEPQDGEKECLIIY